MRASWVGEELVILRDLPPGPVWSLAEALAEAQIPGLIEATPAWDTIGLYVDPSTFALDSALALLSAAHPSTASPCLHHIPVCYEMGEDLEEAADLLGLLPSELSALHSSAPYPCRAVGFCPGFPYLGPLVAPLDKLPRRAAPRVRVPAGSVAAAAGQTGIYPLERPGGWMILGRTPLQIVDEKAGWFPIRAGDIVQFYRITHAEFLALEGMRLADPRGVDRE